MIFEAGFLVASLDIALLGCLFRKFVSFRFEGAFYQEPLIRQLEETGFQVIAFEDRSDDLEDWLKKEAKAGRNREEALTGLNRYLKSDVGGRHRNIGYCQVAAVKPL